MKIQNKKTQIEKGIVYNDKDYMYRTLSSLKELTKGYATALIECSNERLVKEYKKMFDEVLSLQRCTYELMFRNGWYVLESIDSKKRKTELKKLESELIDLNCEEEN